MNIRAAIKKYPVATFVVCTFALSALTSFAPFGDLDYEMKFQLLATLIVPIPTIVALILASMTGGIRAFLHEILSGRVRVRWLVIALGIALLARLSISLIALLTGAISIIEVSAAPAPLIIMIYLFALLEEIGWRGFALRRLARDHAPLVALLITGIPWSAIHILFYLALGKDLGTVLVVFGYMLGLSVMVTWIYLRNGQNIWPAVILHGSQTLFGILNANVPADVINLYSLIVYSLIALALLALDWRMWFARPEPTQAVKAVPATT